MLSKLPKDWNIIPLGQAATIHDSRRVPLSSQQRAKMKGQYPYCGANGIIDYINDYIFDGEYVLLAEDGGYWGAYEKSAYVMNGKFWVNNHAHIIQAINNISNNTYLMYTLNYMELNRYISGTTRGKLNQGVMKNITITLPPLPEQRAIAHVLSTVRRSIEATERVIAAARELKRSMMKYLFTYGPVPVDQAEMVKLKETEVGLVPEGWEVVELDSVIEKPQYGYTETASKDPIGPHFLRITDIKDGGSVNWVTVPYCQCNDVDFQKYELEQDDILVARIGATTGKTFIVNNPPHSVFASYLIRIRPILKLLTSLYIFYFMNSRLYWSQIDAIKGGRLKQGINIPNIRNLLIPLPGIYEQSQIGNILKNLDIKMEIELRKRASLEVMFDSLLHHLMTGKVRVRDLPIPKSLP